MRLVGPSGFVVNCTFSAPRLADAGPTGPAACRYRASSKKGEAGAERERNREGKVMHFICLHFLVCSAEACDGWCDGREPELRYCLCWYFFSHDHDDDTISEVFTLIASRGSYVDGRLLSNTEGRWCKQHRGKVVHSFVCNFFLENVSRFLRRVFRGRGLQTLARNHSFQLGALVHCLSDCNWTEF